MKIATFNVNSIRARLHVMERFLADDAPDVLCLQETKCQNGDFPTDLFASRGYEVAFSGMKSYNGVAIASRVGIEGASFGIGDGRDTEQDACRIARARVCGVEVICAYMPQGKEIGTPEFEYKLEFFDRVRAMLDARSDPSSHVLLVGDLNVAPTDIDVTSPERKRDHVCFCEEAKRALANITDWGFVDAYRKHRPGPGEFSFWDYRVKNSLDKNIGWRIDHILATKPLADVCTDAYAARDLRAMERPSDHTAVVGVFDIACPQ